MKQCKLCGVPDIIKRDQDWNDDGTITITGDDKFRMGIMELSVLHGIVERLEKAIGPAIHQMFMETSTRYTRRYVNNLLKGALGFMVKKTKAGAKLAYTKLLDTAICLGFGKIDLQSYEHKKRISGTIFNPYYLPLFVGDVGGAFESIENAPAKVEWTETENKATVTVSIKEDGTMEEARFDVKEDIRLAGTLEYEVCKKCGLPEGLKNFKWHLDKGMIIDERTEERVVIMGLNDLSGVFNELKDVAGDVLPTSFFDTNKEYALKAVKNGWIKDYQQLAADLSLKGMALVNASEGRNAARFEITNAFNREYVLGRCVGTFEGLEKRSGRIVMSETPGLIELSIIRS